MEPTWQKGSDRTHEVARDGYAKDSPHLRNSFAELSIGKRPYDNMDDIMEDNNEERMTKRFRDQMLETSLYQSSNSTAVDSNAARFSCTPRSTVVDPLQNSKLEENIHNYNSNQQFPGMYMDPNQHGYQHNQELHQKYPQINQKQFEDLNIRDGKNLNRHDNVVLMNMYEAQLKERWHHMERNYENYLILAQKRSEQEERNNNNSVGSNEQQQQQDPQKSTNLSEFHDPHHGYNYNNTQAQGLTETSSPATHLNMEPLSNEHYRNVNSYLRQLHLENIQRGGHS